MNTQFPSREEILRLARVVILFLVPAAAILHSQAAQPELPVGKEGAADPGLETKLLQVLTSNASAAEKDAACQQLKTRGTARCVPALAGLLVDDQLSHSARYVLESMPLPEAGAALLAAVEKTSGSTQAGIVCSLGMRGDVSAVPVLSRLAKGPDREPALAATRALGYLASGEALEALRKLASASPVGPLHDAAVDGLLRQAHWLVQVRRNSEALKLYKSLYDSEKADGVRLAAYRGMIRASGRGGFKLVTAALLGPPSPAQLAVLQLARQAESGGTAAGLAGLLSRVDLPVQIALVEALAQRGDPAAAPALLRYLNQAPPEVRLPILRALGLIGDAEAVQALAQFAASGSPAEQAAARQALVILHRGRVADAMVRQLAASRPAAQGELARALGERRDQAALPKLLDLAQKGPESARNPAINALGMLVDEPRLGLLVNLVQQTPDFETRTRAAEALNQACQRIVLTQGSVDVKPLVEAAVSGPKEARVALMPICSGLANPQVRLVIRSGLQDPDPQVSAAAVRALCDTVDPELAEDLLALAQRTRDEKHRSLAVAGAVRLLTQEDTLKIPTSQRVAALRLLLAAAARPEEKRLVLAGLGEMPDMEALRILEPMLAESDFQAEAARAASRIAVTLREPQVREAMTILRKTAPSVVEETARRAMLAALNEMEQTADYITDWMVAGPFRQDGKDFAALFDIVFPPETGDAQGVSWRPFPPGSDPKRPYVMDLLALLGGQQCVAYARTWIRTDKECTAVLELGSDDGVKIWLNDDQVFALNTARPLQPGSEKVTLKLRSGWNRLLLKITQNNLGWEFCARLRQPDGLHMEGLQVEAAPSPTSAPTP